MEILGFAQNLFSSSHNVHFGCSVCHKGFGHHQTDTWLQISQRTMLFKFLDLPVPLPVITAMIPSTEKSSRRSMLGQLAADRVSLDTLLVDGISHKKCLGLLTVHMIDSDQWASGALNNNSYQDSKCIMPL